MYRGIKKYSYPLIPSIGRLLNKEPFTTKEKLLKFEKSAFNEFQIDVYNQLRETNPFFLLAVAQHHGLKTRLLDWTLSPLIAIFFAVEAGASESSHEDGALIAFQTQPHLPFNNIEDAKSPFDDQLAEYVFLAMPDISPRIRVQQGVFQMFKNPTVEFKEAYNLGKFRIPAKNKENIKRELADLGITYKTIFPDLDGLCRTINYFKLSLREEK